MSDGQHAVAKILAMGLLEGNYFPVQLSKTFLERTIFGKVHSDLTSDFIDYMSPSDAELMKHALDNFDVNYDDPIDNLDTFQCKWQPTKDNFKKLMKGVADKEMIQKPMFVIDCWHPILKEILDNEVEQACESETKSQEIEARMIEESRRDLMSVNNKIARFEKTSKISTNSELSTEQTTKHGNIFSALREERDTRDTTAEVSTPPGNEDGNRDGSSESNRDMSNEVSDRKEREVYEKSIQEKFEEKIRYSPKQSKKVKNEGGKAAWKAAVLRLVRKSRALVELARESAGMDADMKSAIFGISEVSDTITEELGEYERRTEKEDGMRKARQEIGC
ncbi:unnamed protein product [Phaedon cochleariae]|uniref:Uncharacterized protein n=1 Tax=Phaedon cochleariae TaxID=80249 RepID=A0A9N9SJK1_PHACE|nr:unnamed protein product [Phaedon cochleariae]